MALAVLLGYPALQLPMLWLIVRYAGLRNDDGPDDPRGYSDRTADRPPGRCRRCGTDNGPGMAYCRECVAPLSRPR